MSVRRPSRSQGLGVGARQREGGTGSGEIRTSTAPLGWRTAHGAGRRSSRCTGRGCGASRARRGGRGRRAGRWKEGCLRFFGWGVRGEMGWVRAGTYGRSSNQTSSQSWLCASCWMARGPWDAHACSSTRCASAEYSVGCARASDGVQCARSWVSSTTYPMKRIGGGLPCPDHGVERGMFSYTRKILQRGARAAHMESKSVVAHCVHIVGDQ